MRKITVPQQPNVMDAESIESHFPVQDHLEFAEALSCMLHGAAHLNRAFPQGALELVVNFYPSESDNKVLIVACVADERDRVVATLFKMTMDLSQERHAISIEGLREFQGKSFSWKDVPNLQEKLEGVLESYHFPAHIKVS